MLKCLRSHKQVLNKQVRNFQRSFTNKNKAIYVKKKDNTLSDAEQVGKTNLTPDFYLKKKIEYLQIGRQMSLKSRFCFLSFLSLVNIL